MQIGDIVNDYAGRYFVVLSPGVELVQVCDGHTIEFVPTFAITLNHGRGSVVGGNFDPESQCFLLDVFLHAQGYHITMVATSTTTHDAMVTAMTPPTQWPKYTVSNRMQSFAERN